MIKFTKTIVLAVVALAIGFAILRPIGVEETTVAFVSLVLLAVAPSCLHPSLSRHWSGLVIGLLLGLSLAAVFRYWFWMLPMMAAGWIIGLASHNTNESTLRLRPRLTLAMLLSLVVLVATLLTVWSQQNKLIARYNNNGAEFSQTFFGRPNSCRIVVKIESGLYVIGEEKTDDYAIAARTLRTLINRFVGAGTSPHEISIICEASNQLDKDRIWMLREAFDNVDGHELNVSFRTSIPPPY